MCFKKSCFIFFILFSNLPLFSQTLPDGGTDITNYKRLRFLSYEKDSVGFVTSDKVEDLEPVTLTVENTEQPDFIYNLSLRLPVKKTALKPGDKILISFEGKTEFSNLETGEARALFIFNINADRRGRPNKTVSVGSEWKQYFIPVEVTEKVGEDDFAVVMQFGFPPQKFYLKNIQFHKYGKDVALADLPKTKITYAGMEENAPWRWAAAERIGKHRVGDFKLQFSCKGKPLKGQAVQVKLKRHHFGWGAGVDAENVTEDGPDLQHFSEAFNLAVFRNDLKIKAWGKPEKRTQTMAAIDMLLGKDIDLKGHVLIWPGFRYLTPEFRKNQDDPDKINQLMERHLKSILSTTKGKVSRWDVVNEAYTNQDLQRITGSEEILFNGFRKLHENEPDVLRFTNEYGIISKGGLDTKKQQWYFDYIKRLDKNTGGLVDGIGIQCHIGSDLTPPEKVVEILDFYALLGKKISISEFTMDIDDPEVRTQYTRDFLIAAFSHPSVSEFLFWGYQWEKADIFTDDWEAGSMGKAYFELVHGIWKTDLVLETDKQGMASGKGFYGKYEYTVVVKGKVETGEFELLPGGSGVVEIGL